MKRLLALLLLVVAPAFAQDVSPYADATQTGNLVPDFSFDGPIGTTPNNWTLEGNNFSGGAIQPGCGGLSNQGQCFQFSYMGATLATTIDLSLYNTNSFEFYFDFFYRINCNNSIGGYCENPDGPRDLFGASVQFFTEQGEASSFNFIPIGPDYFKAGDPGVNGLDYKAVGWYSSQQSEFLFTSAIISFYGIDSGFWGGYYGPAIDRVNFRIGYLDAPDPVIGVDCTLDPYDPSCVIDTIGIDDGVIDYTDPEEILAAIEEQEAAQEELEELVDDESNDGSDDGSEYVEEDEEIYFADEEATEELLDADLEEMLAEETDEEEILLVEDATEDPADLAEPAVVAAYRELTDEEKAAILADAISKNILEGALSIASDATAAASGSAAATTTVQTENASRSTTVQSASISTTAESSTTIEMKVEEEKVEVVVASEAGADILETGRQTGREALAATSSQSEQSATESVAQAESIAITSSETQIVVAVSNDAQQTTVVEDAAVAISNRVEELDDSRREIQQVVSDDTSSSSTAEIEQQIVAQSETVNESDSIMTVTDNNTTEQTFEDKTEIVAVADNSTTEQTDTFAEIMQMEIKPVTEESVDADVEFVQQLAATAEQQRQEEINNSGFSEEEKVTIANDPALANVFNLAPNVTNLEVAGVLNNKQEEKSDAEKRADEVVAANAKEQEEINKNYMDADQSGIVAAMGADTDVSAYRTAMLNDNNIWYRPEDIYRGIIIKDNVRGSYFLEKGSTDTYKKMIQEQYK